MIGAHPVGAQTDRTLHGIVVEASTRVRLANAIVVLRSLPSGSEVAARSTSDGRFIAVVAAGDSLSISVQRIGFTPSIFVAAFRDLADTVVLNVHSVAALPTVTVTESEKSISLTKAGFFERQKAGFGIFMDSATVARRMATSTFKLLRGYIKGCTMIYVDGIPGRLGDIPPEEIIGIEIYASNLQAPLQFHNPGGAGAARCGSIVVWRQGSR